MREASLCRHALDIDARGVDGAAIIRRRVADFETAFDYGFRR